MTLFSVEAFLMPINFLLCPYMILLLLQKKGDELTTTFKSTNLSTRENVEDSCKE